MSTQKPLDIILLNDPQQLVFCGKDAEPITLELKNNDTREAISVLVNVVRGDLLKKDDLVLTSEELIGGGQKVVDNMWVEVRLPKGTWQPVDDWDNPFDLGSLSPDSTVVFELRLNVPASNADCTRMCFALMISSKPEDEPQIRGICINEPVFVTYKTTTAQATATVTHDLGGLPEVLWSSSNPAICSVDGTGLLTGVETGRVIITATSGVNPRYRSSRFAMVSPTPPPALYETFESYPEGSFPTNMTLLYNGTGTANQKVITAIGHDGFTKLMRLQGQSSWAAETMWEPMPTGANTITVDVWMRGIAGTWPGTIRTRNPSGSWGTGISGVNIYSDGTVTAIRNGNYSDTVLIATGFAGAWLRVTMVHNMIANTYDIYLLGSLVLANIPMHPTLTMTQVSMVAGNIGTNEIYFDNLGVFVDTPKELIWANF